MWWVRFINLARNEEEKNVELYSDGKAFYCKVVKHIVKGKELLLWFDEKLGEELGITSIKEEKKEGM